MCVIGDWMVLASELVVDFFNQIGVVWDDYIRVNYFGSNACKDSITAL